MKIISPRAFAALCYLVLMDHHDDGYGSAHPSYIEEKLVLLERGYEAYAALDHLNQLKVRSHLKDWGYEEPDEIKFKNL